MAFPYILVGIGAILCVLAAMESYLQLSDSPFSLLELSHKYGYLLKYEKAVQPNKGLWHPLAWIGSAFFIIMMLYSVRKHLSFMQDVGPLRYWLDTHMFLGVVATVFVTVHTTYKVGGLVSISFWSMILVATSGIVGRYIYIQIPRNIQGRELQIDQIQEIMEDINGEIKKYAGDDQKILRYFELISGPKQTERRNVFRIIFLMFLNDFGNLGRTYRIRKAIYANPELPSGVKKRLFRLIKEKGELIRSSNFLTASQKLLHYWHVFHKPFAFIMFLIMFIHIAVYMVFKAGG